MGDRITLMCACRQVMAVVLAASFVASCTGYRQITLPTSQPAAGMAARGIDVGDVVRVTLADHQEREFRVTAIEPDALVGADGQRVAYADVVVLERRAVSPIRTAVLLMSPLIALGGLLAVTYAVCSIRNCR